MIALPPTLILSSICLAGFAIAAPLVAQEAAVGTVPKLAFRVEADYLALHVSGEAPAGAKAVEHRLTVAGPPTQTGPWTAVAINADDDGFAFDVPLPDWRWVRLELRTRVGGEEWTTREATPKVRKFSMLTPERIEALPEPQRNPWQRYMERSLRDAEHEREILASECRNLDLATSKPATSSGSDFKIGSKLEASWYARAEACLLCGNFGSKRPSCPRIANPVVQVVGLGLHPKLWAAHVAGSELPASFPKLVLH